MPPWRIALLAAFACSTAFADASNKRPEGGPGATKQGLRVSITGAESYAEGAPVTVRVSVENTSKRPIDILQRTDSFTVDVAWPSPSREGCTHRYTGTRSRRISFAQTNRGQLAPTPTPLAAGATFEVELDLASWAKSGSNGTTPLGAGAFKAVARYRKLSSRPLGFVVEGTPPAGRCTTNPGWQFWGPGR